MKRIFFPHGFRFGASTLKLILSQWVRSWLIKNRIRGGAGLESAINSNRSTKFSRTATPTFLWPPVPRLDRDKKFCRCRRYQHAAVVRVVCDASMTSLMTRAVDLLLMLVADWYARHGVASEQRHLIGARHCGADHCTTRPSSPIHLTVFTNSSSASQCSSATLSLNVWSLSLSSFLCPYLLD